MAAKGPHSLDGCASTRWGLFNDRERDCAEGQRDPRIEAGIKMPGGKAMR